MKNKNVMGRMKDFLMPPDDYVDGDDIEEIEEKQQVEQSMPKQRSFMNQSTNQSKIVSIGGQVMDHGKMEILNLTMVNYEMTGEVFNYVKNRKPIIVNMQQLNAADVQRAVDYLTGACFALNGSVERVADNIFVFAPESVNLSPEKMKQKNTWPMV